MFMTIRQLVPYKTVLGDGTVVIADRGGAQRALETLTLALPLVSAGRDTALVAPLATAGWARAVTAAARRAGAEVRVEPVLSADFVGLTVECVGGRHGMPVRAVPDWIAAVAEPWRNEPREQADEAALRDAKRACLAGLTTDERWSSGVLRALFGPHHRYGLVHDERVARIAGCEAEDLRPVTRDLLTGPPVVALSLADPADEEAVRDALATAGRHPGQPGHPGVLPAAPRSPLPGQRPVALSLPGGRDTAYHLLGTPGVSLGSPDKFAVHMAWAMLGGREGMFGRRLREGRALTYSLAAFSREFAEAGYGVCMAVCRPGALREVADRTAAVLGDLAEGRFERALVASAKERLVIQNHRALQSGRDVTRRLCGYEIAGLPAADLVAYADRIGRVTGEQVRDVARRRLCIDEGGDEQGERTDGTTGVAVPGQEHGR